MLNIYPWLSYNPLQQMIENKYVLILYHVSCFSPLIQADISYFYFESAAKLMRYDLDLIHTLVYDEVVHTYFRFRRLID